MSIFHVFPVQFNGMDIEQCRLSPTHVYLTPSNTKQQIEPSLTVNNDNAHEDQKRVQWVKKAATN